MAASGWQALALVGQAHVEVRRLTESSVRMDLWVVRARAGGLRRDRHQPAEVPIPWRWRDQWREYTLYFDGVLRALPAWPPPWPVWLLPPEDRPPQAGDQAIQLLRQTARCAHTRPYAEVVWHEAEGGCTTAIQDAGQPGVTEDEILRAWQGFKLLQELPGARGVGRKGLDPAEVKEQMYRAWYAHWSEHAEAPGPDDMCKALWLADRSSYYDRVRLLGQHKTPWPPPWPPPDSAASE